MADPHLEIAGVQNVRGELRFIDVPLAKLPADLSRVEVSLTYASACGRKAIAFPLPPRIRPAPGTEYKPEKAQDDYERKAADYYYRAADPKPRLELPKAQRVFVDPAYTGPFELEPMKGQITSGTPDKQLTSSNTPVLDGIVVGDLNCPGATVKLGATSIPVPSGFGPSLFVTTDSTKCFVDEIVGTRSGSPRRRARPRPTRAPDRRTDIDSMSAVEFGGGGQI